MPGKDRDNKKRRVRAQADASWRSEFFDDWDEDDRYEADEAEEGPERAAYSAERNGRYADRDEAHEDFDDREIDSYTADEAGDRRAARTEPKNGPRERGRAPARKRGSATEDRGRRKQRRHTDEAADGRARRRPAARAAETQRAAREEARGQRGDGQRMPKAGMRGVSRLANNQPVEERSVNAADARRVGEQRDLPRGAEPERERATENAEQAYFRWRHDDDDRRGTKTARRAPSSAKREASNAAHGGDAEPARDRRVAATEERAPRKPSRDGRRSAADRDAQITWRSEFEQDEEAPRRVPRAKDSRRDDYTRAPRETERRADNSRRQPEAERRSAQTRFEREAALPEYEPEAYAGDERERRPRDYVSADTSRNGRAADMWDDEMPPETESRDATPRRIARNRPVQEEDEPVQEEWTGEPGGGSPIPETVSKALDSLGAFTKRVFSSGERPAPANEPSFSQNKEERYGVYGGSAHDNLPPPDARLRVGLKPVLIIAAVAALLVLLIPSLLPGRTGNRISVSDARHGASQGYVLPTLAPTEPPQSTPEPTAEPDPNLFVSEYTGRTLSRARPAVALTFDDGPSAQTERIVQLFAQYDEFGTFFFTGSRINEYSAAAASAYASGNLIGTHMYSHTAVDELTVGTLQHELDQCRQAHISATGVAPVVARTPQGLVNDMALSYINMPLINWSLDSRDWELQDADKIVNEVLNNVRDGDIVLFHDARASTTEALARLLPALSEQGYQLVTVQELFELHDERLQPGNVYTRPGEANG